MNDYLTWIIYGLFFIAIAYILIRLSIIFFDFFKWIHREPEKEDPFLNSVIKAISMPSLKLYVGNTEHRNIIEGTQNIISQMKTRNADVKFLKENGEVNQNYGLVSIFQIGGKLKVPRNEIVALVNRIDFYPGLKGNNSKGGIADGVYVVDFTVIPSETLALAKKKSA